MCKLKQETDDCVCFKMGMPLTFVGPFGHDPERRAIFQVLPERGVVAWIESSLISGRSVLFRML
jgi:hypothetical protein